MRPEVLIECRLDIRTLLNIFVSGYESNAFKDNLGYKTFLVVSELCLFPFLLNLPIGYWNIIFYFNILIPSLAFEFQNGDDCAFGLETQHTSRPVCADSIEFSIRQTNVSDLTISFFPGCSGETFLLLQSQIHQGQVYIR